MSKKKQEKEKPKVFVVVLTGLPGSGKSYISCLLEKVGWNRVSQDELGNLQNCKDFFEKSIKKGKSVIVDRCNPHDKERKMWITEAKKLGIEKDCIESVFLDISDTECIKRVQNRKGHPTLSGDKAEEVISSFGTSLKAPTDYEGFGKIHVIQNESDARGVVKLLSDYPINKK